MSRTMASTTEIIFIEQIAQYLKEGMTVEYLCSLVELADEQVKTGDL